MKEEAINSGNAPKEEPTSQSLDLNALLLQYGQAMARVGQLENQLQNLQEKLKALEGEGGEVGTGIRSTLEEKEKELKKKDETISSLNIQLMTVRAQLSRTEEKLKLVEEGAYIKHRRRHHRRWWRFWRR